MERDVPEVARISADLGKRGLVNVLKEEELRKTAKSAGYYVVVARVAAGVGDTGTWGVGDADPANDNVLGFAISSYSWGKLHIEEVGVRKDMQGRGIGKKLIRHLIEHAKERKLPEVYCEVKEKNAASLRLFFGLGFQERLHIALGADAFYGLYVPLEA